MLTLVSAGFNAFYRFKYVDIGSFSVCSLEIFFPCVLVLVHNQLSMLNSKTQEHNNRKCMQVPGCVLVIKDASNTGLRDPNR